MNIFLDANILVSVLNKEYPLFTYSARILSLSDNPKFTVYTSPICLAIAYYFAEKKSGALAAKKKIEILIQKIKITSVDHQSVVQTIQNKSIEDFEDGMEYYSAQQSKCKCIVTEDVADFHFSSIEVLDSKAFFDAYMAT
jgi:predicted nucleic acid-binding protein